MRTCVVCVCVSMSVFQSRADWGSYLALPWPVSSLSSMSSLFPSEDVVLPPCPPKFALPRGLGCWKHLPGTAGPGVHGSWAGSPLSWVPPLPPAGSGNAERRRERNGSGSTADRAARPPPVTVSAPLGQESHLGWKLQGIKTGTSRPSHKTHGYIFTLACVSISNKLRHVYMV